ncbi:helix-turn-helix domain-containing protein [Azospirillum doebereinerae]|uniref:helix-turn-helix domain-containing protein n=1 Tax=Azospirillum doebereinerae TaxID=92933 RepID=UPI001EE5EED6|nr:helix-turn-helix domain-containing protein [Azospirillum doebereinerae]MCG5240059.1 helix-turn-helix domain-containing protein [Azospirillum doebereinerae]
MTEKGRVLPQRFTEAEAAAEIGISRGSLRNLRREEKIGYVKILNKIYYLPEQIKEYFHNQRVEPCQTTAESRDTSKDTGSNRSPAGRPASGTAHGMIDPAVRSAASQLARETFR